MVDEGTTVVPGVEDAEVGAGAAEADKQEEVAAPETQTETVV